MYHSLRNTSRTYYNNNIIIAKQNLAVGPKIAIAKILLVDLNLAILYEVGIRIILYASKKF